MSKDGPNYVKLCQSELGMLSALRFRIVFLPGGHALCEPHGDIEADNNPL